MCTGCYATDPVSVTLYTGDAVFQCRGMISQLALQTSKLSSSSLALALLCVFAFIPLDVMSPSRVTLQVKQKTLRNPHFEPPSNVAWIWFAKTPFHLVFAVRISLNQSGYKLAMPKKQKKKQIWVDSLNIAHECPKFYWSPSNSYWESPVWAKVEDQ